MANLKPIILLVKEIKHPIGKAIFPTYNNSNLIMLNVETVETHYRQSAPIDLNLVTPLLDNYIQIWQVFIDNLSSNHYPIITKIDTTYLKHNNKECNILQNNGKRNYDKANWTLFGNIIKKKLKTVHTKNKTKIDIDNY